MKIFCAYDKQVKIEDLKPNPKNPNKHPKKQIELLAKIIESQGWRAPITVSKRSGLVVRGHGRLMAAEFLGLKKCPVDLQEYESAAAEWADLIADNRLSELSEIDDVALGEVLRELEGSDELDNTGYLESELSRIFSGTGGGLTDDDDVPDKAEKRAKLGDLFALGDHRLLCGDATNGKDVKRLMGKNKANMIFTDPPYNVDYGANKPHPSWNVRSIPGDKQTADEWKDFCLAVFPLFMAYNTGDIYVWGASGPEGMKQRLWLVELGFHWSATIIWKKQQLILSPAKYQRMYEPCFYGWLDKSSFCGDRKMTEVWEFDRPHVSKLHPTMKPVEMCCHGIRNSSKRGDIVADWFGGAGSTLIACEKIKRRCFMLEIAPNYCDVIIQRWEEFTGKKARKLK